MVRVITKPRLLIRHKSLNTTWTNNYATSFFLIIDLILAKDIIKFSNRLITNTAKIGNSQVKSSSSVKGNVSKWLINTRSSFLTNIRLNTS